MPNKHFIDYDPQRFGITDDHCNPYPALVNRGCSCCQTYHRVTRANLDLAIRQAKEWLAQLEAMNPVAYPADVEGGEG